MPDQDKDNKKKSRSLFSRKLPLAKDLNFGAAESYRLLRTNLLFSLPDEQRCRVIGVTSSNATEGKSTTSLNLAYMLAEADKKVILMEADMRLPTIAGLLELDSTPGLSNLLVGMSKGKDTLQKTSLSENLMLISSGDIPPNPSELLGSAAMRNTLESLTVVSDFIIMDLPPINEVSDALVVSPLLDGIIMVVRQNYTTRRSVAEAIRQLEHANAKVLGFVMTRANSGRKNTKYSYKYGYGYGYSGYGRYGRYGGGQ